MNKKEKGFTLIELLAVIVILAIILLIATPIILNVIDDAKKGAFKNSANYLVSTAENEYMLKILNNESLENLVYKYENGNVVGGVDLNYRGEKPKNGTIVIREDGKVGMAIDNGIWCAKKEYNSDEVTLTKLSQSECILNDVPEIGDTSGANKPELVTGMTPIKWDEENNEIETTEDDTEWYNYNEQRWANVKTEDGSYWVWIPRYAYKITNGFHESETGTIEVKFLKGKTNEATDSTVIETSGYEVGVKDTSMNYFLHPAFQFDGEELGFWVAKFEPTAAEGVTTVIGTCSGDNVTTKTVKIIPNATTWRCINIANAFNVSLNMKEKADVYGWNPSKVDTHMMKNTEWGAVAYLSKSVYGADTEEIWNNSYNQYQTGCSGSGVNAANESTCTEYNTENGVKASTTQNIYGVYDMSGGVWDRVMANYNNIVASSGFNILQLESLDDKYIDRYNTQTQDLINGIGMNYDRVFYGDAVFETSNNAAIFNGSTWNGNQQGSWYSDESHLPYAWNPWFMRGSRWFYSNNVGLFTFANDTGGADVNISFRPVVFVK